MAVFSSATQFFSHRFFGICRFLSIFNEYIYAKQMEWWVVSEETKNKRILHSIILWHSIDFRWHETKQSFQWVPLPSYRLPQNKGTFDQYFVNPSYISQANNVYVSSIFIACVCVCMQNYFLIKYLQCIQFVPAIKFSRYFHFEHSIDSNAIQNIGFTLFLIFR